MQIRKVREKPASGGFRFVPALFDSAIDQDLSRPLRFRITWVHAEPHDEHAHIGSRIFCQEIVLRPPGAGYARRSRGRQQEDQPRVTVGRVEPALEIVDALKVAETGRRRLSGPWRDGEYDRKRDATRNESSGAANRSHGHQIIRSFVNPPTPVG